MSKQVADLDPPVLDGGAAAFPPKPTVFGTWPSWHEFFFSSATLRYAARELEKKNMDFNVILSSLGNS